MPITIQEIIASDTISQFVDKTNFNFDQLLLNGGGPGGPIGPKGPTGPGGGRGPKGSTWYEDIATSTPGNNPNTVSPTATPFNKDYYLQFNGQVWEYNGTTAVWDITTIDLQGPPGTAGGGGGFGLTIGSPVINQSNIRYNGPIGDNNGANNINEGVPSVLIGGVTSLTTALPGINFTGAYIVPDTIITGNSSYLTSLLIHQKDSQSRGIVFHGGAAIGSGDNFEQSDPSQLSNIRLDVDDTLVLSVPKAPTTPLTQTQMLGFQVLTPLRAQQFFAGSNISIESGTGPDTIDFASQHSNIEINVGTGGTGGNGSLFRTVTQGSISTTLLEAGNTTQIALVTNQALQTGNWQVQAGEIRMVSSNTKNLGLYSGGNLRLNTLDGGGTFTGTGSIILSAGSGGINLNSTNLGDVTGNAENVLFTASAEVSIFAGDNMGLHASDDMTIKVDDGNMVISQLFSTTDSTTLGRNIDIQNSGLPQTGSLGGIGTAIQRIGRITAKNYTQIILAHYGQDTEQRSMPSIVIDQNYNAANSIKVFPHTRFVGQQTWQRDAFGSATNTGGILYPQGDSPAQYNALEGLVTNSKNFRQTGNSNLDGISPGAAYEIWSGGMQSTSVNAGVDAGTIKIYQGNEYPSNSDPIYIYPGSPSSYDRSLTLAVRDSPNNSSSTKQFFSTNSNKTAIGNPFILNRTQALAGTNGESGNTKPAASSTIDVAPGVPAMTTNYPSWGLDYRSDPGLIPSSGTTTALGMPTTAELTSPLITLKFGIGVGKLYGPAEGGAGLNNLDFEFSPGVGVDNSFIFPVGMYPGQRITLVIECYSIRGSVGSLLQPPITPLVWFGMIRVNVPANRSSATLQGLQSTSWYEEGGVSTAGSYINNTYPTSNQRRNFTQIINQTRGPVGNSINNDASNCVTTTKQIDMIWDGTVTKTWGSTFNLQPSMTPGQIATPLNLLGTVYTQAGWRILSNTTVKTGEGKYGRNVWIPFP